MYQKITRLAALLALLWGFVMPVMAQQVPTLPVDPDVRIGKLDNGLTYYIRHNNKPKGQADFYIAQKVGSILEDENQRGLAHFLEHMCFNGTENFPGNTMVDWLESIGVKFGQNLNAYTGVDQTVYNISNVPVARTGVQDTTLLILHDWADGLLLDPEEIDKERGVIHQEWRRSMVGQMRIVENILPEAYPGSKYGYRLPIGTMEIVDNFPPQALRDYYEKWYRPDQQGVIVVGDIDVDYIEGKIKEIFSTIKMPENPAERTYEPVPDTPGIIYAMGSDPEQANAIIDLFYKSDPVPAEMKATAQYPMMMYMIQMAMNMLDQRLTDLGKDPNAEFAQAGVAYGPFIFAKTKDAFEFQVVAKGDDIIPGFEQAYRELLRAKRGGFTVGEYERAREEYLSGLESKYNGRKRVSNETYVDQYVNNFIDGEPLMSIEQEYELMNQYAPMIQVDMINQMFPELVGDDNRVLMGYFPDNGTFQIPTEEQLAAAMAKVEAEDIEPYRDAMKEEPLIPTLPTPGKVVATIHNDQWDADILTLSNGVNVYVKHTDNKPDQIIFDAIAIGGSSAIPDENADNLIFMPIAMTRHGLGDYTSSDLEKYLQGKQVAVNYGIDDFNREMQGFTTVKDLPTLMELIYMNFIDYNITEDEFAATQSMYANLLKNQASRPEFIFQKDIMESLYASKVLQMITSENINAADRGAILDIIHGSLANAADFVFFFVGDVTADQIAPLAEQYLATLPAIAEKSTSYAQNAGREVKAGSSTEQFTMKMETPQTYVDIVVCGNLPYNPMNKQLASISAQILSNRLLKKIREEMGAVYSIYAMGDMSRQGQMNTTIQIPFPMKPEMKDEVLAEIHSMIEGMAKEVTADELNPIKEFMLKSAAEAKESNSTIAQTMAAVQLNGVDTYNGIESVIESITTKDVEKFMKELLNCNNYHVVVLDPAAE